MPNKEFLEEYPLFRKIKTVVPEVLQALPKPPINMKCEICGSVQTFNMINGYSNIASMLYSESKGEILKIAYKCQSCHEFTRLFMVYVSPNLDYYYKFGQYPEWEIKIDKNIEKTLGKHSDTFKKGFICESQGFGIGAFAYYRRITEQIIDELLDSITDLIETENREKYKAALIETKKTRITQDKINLIKNLLPTILRPNSMNPLGVLHSELSKGLHSESEENCLDCASHIRSILLFLINQILHTKKSSNQFSSSMKALLDKKSKKL